MSVFSIVAATVLWGFFGVFDKIAVRKLHPLSLILVSSVAYMIEFPILLLIWRKVVRVQVWDKTSVLFASLTALTSILATYAYSYAIRDNEVSKVVVITSTYPVLTMLISVLFLQEPLTWQKAVGTALTVLGVAIVSS